MSAYTMSTKTRMTHNFETSSLNDPKVAVGGEGDE
jgi:hypothetical protein